jgi:cytochrome c-type biogenesis protein CcmH/NrfG/membrane protein implicated in regulation of membrane protease activity
MYQNAIHKFNIISFTILTGLCVLLPFFFLPATVSGLGATKAVVLYIGVFLSFSFWLVAQFLEGSFKVPKHWAFAALGLWVVFTLIGALTSQNVGVSLWGRGFAVDSFATVLVVGLFTFLVAAFARDQRRLVQLFLAAFAGSVLTIFLQVVLYLTQRTHFVSTYLAHVTTQGTLVGSWVDFAYFVIFTFLLALLMYEVLMPKGFFKVLSLVALVLSLLVLVFLNFTVAWIITIISALLVFVYKSSVERSLSKRFVKNAEEEQESAEDHNQRFPLMSFIALLVGLFFFLSSSSIGAGLAHYAGVSFTDIRPSFATTTHVMRASLAHHPLFGAGPGRYADTWNLYHPIAINGTIFWNTSFDTGYSFLQSVLTTNGILPIIFLIALLGLAVVHGFKLFNYQFPDRFSRFIGVATLIILVAFICLIVFASPGLVLIAFGFMYLGMMLGVSTLVGRTKLMSFNYLHDPRTSFFAILAIVLAAMAGFTAVYFSGNRFASVIYYNRAIAAQDIYTAQDRLDKALALSPNDIYWRTRTTLFTNQFTAMAGQQNPDKSQLQTLFSQAEQSAQAAVAWDPTNANNWLTLSQVYQLVSNAQNTQAYNNAKSAADQAQKLNPNNPVFILNQAQLALTKQDTGTAFNYIAQALAIKADYLDAYILKAQIEQAGGTTNAAVQEITLYTQVAPFDDQGYLLLGQAQMQQKNYPEALSAYARARDLNPTNPNNYLQYISALVVAGQKHQAVTALQDFKLKFPQITGIDQEIERLQNGTDTSLIAPPTPTSTIAPKSTPKKK